jgi:D-3-phosphoglycerate dehydrogenase
MRPFKVALVESGEASHSVPAWVHDALRKEGIDFVVRPCESRAELADHASDADLVWVWGSRILSSSRLDAVQKCGAILRSGSGTDNVPIAEAIQRNIMVINTPGAMAEDVSDHTLALLLAVVRQIAAQDRSIRSGVWEFRRENNRWHLRGSTLGLIGFGNIAQLVAQKAVSFGLRILVHDPWIQEAEIRARGAEPADLPTLLTTSDFISLHCPLLPETRHLIGDKQFELMKPHAILINTSRGPVVDESALVRALQQKRIGGAGLDVFEREPLPDDSPLRSLDSVVLTPHIAAYSDVYPESFWRYSVESIIAVANGFWPRAVVTPNIQPKWPLLRRRWPLIPEFDDVPVDGNHRRTAAIK